MTKMNFYQEWANVRKNNMNDTEYVLRFLDYEMDSITPLLSGDKSEIVHIVQLLLSIPVEDMVAAIDHKYDFSSNLYTRPFSAPRAAFPFRPNLWC